MAGSADDFLVRDAPGEENVKTLRERDMAERGAALLLAGLYALWAAAALYGIRQVSAPVLLPDEFGYWSHAASMTGRDWTDVTAQFSWYSFGYSLLLTPLFFCTRNPLVRYRAAVGFNFVLLAFGSFLAYRILRQLFPKEDRKGIAFAAGAVLFYPSCFTYSYTTMTESLLVFLYLLLAYSLLRWFQNPGIGRGLAVGAVSGYLYLVHLRTVGILAAVIFCVFVAIVSGRDRRRMLLSGLCVLGVSAFFVWLSAAGKAWATGQAASPVYTQLAQANDYGGQWSKLRALFTPDGAWQFLVGLWGKIFYLGCASFGLYYWGIGYLFRQVKQLFAQIREKSKWQGDAWIFLWILLSHLSALLISAVYCLGTDRLDGLLYGRYHENTVLLICGMGMLEILRRPEWKRRAIWLAALLCGGFFLTGAFLGTGEISYLEEHSVTGIYYAVKWAGYYGRKTLTYAYLCGGLGSLALLLSAEVAGKRWHGASVFLLAVLLWAPVSLTSARQLIWDVSQSRQADVELLGRLEEAAGSLETGGIWFLTGSEASKSSCIVQYMVPDLPIRLTAVQEIADQSKDGGFILFRNGNPEAEAWCRGQSLFGESPLFEIYYRAAEGTE